jgi:hypothetical protein
VLFARTAAVLTDPLFLRAAFAAAAALAWAAFAPARAGSGARRALGAALVGLLAFALLFWTYSVRVWPDPLPAALGAPRAAGLFAATFALSIAAFAAAGGGGGRGAAFGAALGVVGVCASRWPPLARAIELGGGVFVGPFLAGLLPWAVGLTALGCAAALTFEDFRPHARLLVLGAVAAWALPTLAVESGLAAWWGYGPRTLAEAAGIPTNEDAPRLTVLRLAPSRGRSVSREKVRMAAEGVDLGPESLARLDDFLRRSGYRGVFALEALKDLRYGWLLWWDADRALDADMIASPGRVHPDYRRALELLAAGPVTAERRAKLDLLAREAAASPEGFEDVDGSQYIFEGFSAAYARFGDEANARKWLYRIDNLWPINERKIVVTPVEDFHQGVVSGQVLLDGQPGVGLRVGLFAVETSTATGATTRVLSAAAFPDDEGRFEFADLGPATYELALLGRPTELGGLVEGVPGSIKISEEARAAELPPIRVERETLPVPEAFGPGGLPEPPTPEIPEQSLRLPQR